MKLAELLIIQLSGPSWGCGMSHHILQGIKLFGKTYKHTEILKLIYILLLYINILKVKGRDVKKYI